MPKVIIIANSGGALERPNASPFTYCPFPFAPAIVRSKE